MKPLPPSVWVKGLLAALISGASNGALLVVTNAAFDIFKDAKGLWTAVLVNTVISVAMYLKQSPVPYYDFEGGDVDHKPILNAAEDAKKAEAELRSKAEQVADSWLKRTRDKAPLIAALLLPVIAMAPAGCQTTGPVNVPATVDNVLPYLRPGAAAAGLAFLLTSKSDAEKKDRAVILYTVSTAIRALATPTGGNPPTADELKAALAGITTKNVEDWTAVVTSVVSLYSGFKTQFNSDVTAVFKALDQLALGIEDAAKPYITHPAAPVSLRWGDYDTKFLCCIATP